MTDEEAIAWAVGRWQAEVAHRPLRNIHRRTLDDCWRQMIRHFGGDPEALCGPAHDDLVAENPADAVRQPRAWLYEVLSENGAVVCYRFAPAGVKANDEALTAVASTMARGTTLRGTPLYE